MKRRLLIVDDDPTIRDSLGDALSSPALEVRTADSAERALAEMASWRPDLVLSDVRMPGLSGIDLLKLLRERAPDADVALMTAYDDMPTVVSAMREGAVEFLVKPLDLHHLRKVLDRVLEDRATRNRPGRSEAPADSAGSAEIQGLIGRDPGMIAVYKRVGQAAATRASVLIRGESGTGKELVARAIHGNSPDASEPFVAVNCASLPSTLLESELFGHVRGSFTGASADRKGRFALAGRGTLFLDEIGDTTPELQSKLLRVLQEREFYPVGAERAERTDARVIAATHQDLEAMVARDAFRADLYYRLRVMEIALPPLRERMGDLPLLANYLVQRASRESGRAAPVIARDALDALSQHDWPGNVRELENTLTRAVVLATGDVIHAEHIELARPATPGNGHLGTLDALERAHVERVLAATGGHKARTAQILGVSRPRLDRLLKKHGLD